ncbi:MAG: hypothetical protein J6Y69_09120 [Treponema sp.]|nr:hypothetical protein [Treponema sp.]
MKKKFLVLFVSLFVFGSVSSFAFDWSQCWCNYGGGLDQGDLVLHVDTGFGSWIKNPHPSASYYDSRWTVPYVELGLNYAFYIWKLPFTAGGYVGFDSYGYRHIYDDTRFVYPRVYTGGDIAYHIQLPPEIIDLYAGNRIGIVMYMGDYARNWDWTFDFYAGVNFFFTDSFGLNVEGGTFNWLRAGLSFKL